MPLNNLTIGFEWKVAYQIISEIFIYIVHLTR